MEIDNPFIVYILYGRNEDGADVIYVGKSKNGLSNRPKAHEDKYKYWTTCYVLSEENSKQTFFNDAVIQYLEDKASGTVSEKNYYINTTKVTNKDTANENEKEQADEYWDIAVQMLYILGLDLISPPIKKIGAEEQTKLSLSVPAPGSKKIPPLPDMNLKPGKFVMTAMDNLEASGYVFSDAQWRMFSSIDGSKEYTHRNLSLFRPEAEGKNKRYWNKVYVFGQYRFRMNSQWYEEGSKGASAKSDFIRWYNLL